MVGHRFNFSAETTTGSFITALPAATFTASTDTATFASAHRLIADQPVLFEGLSGAAPLTNNRVYYVKSAPTATTMTLALRPSTDSGGNTTLDITTDGTATSSGRPSAFGSGAIIGATRRRCRLGSVVSAGAANRCS